MNIQPAAPHGATDAPKRVSARDDAKTAAARDAIRTLAGARSRTADFAKAQARARLQQIAERLKILRKLFAANPQEMARALAQVFKELKAAVRAYREAGGQDLAAVGDAARPAADGATPDGPSKDGEAGDAAAAGAPGPDGYAAAVTKVREGIAEDGLDFAKLVRGFANEIAKLLETARGQARAAKPNKETDKEIEGVDKALGDLRAELAAMEHDLHMAVPTAGLRLSVAA